MQAYKEMAYTESCHLTADSLAELLDFAVLSLGLKVAYLQNTKIVHYDLTKGKRRLAIRLGAKEKECYE